MIHDYKNILEVYRQNKSYAQIKTLQMAIVYYHINC